MIDAPSVLAAGAVLGVASCWTQTVRWVSADRARGRLGLAPAPGRPVPAPIGRALDRAGLDTDHRLVLHAWGAAVAIAAVAAVVSPSGLLLLLVATLVPPGAVMACRGRAARQRARQFPLVLDAVAAGLRGGASLRISLHDAASATGGRLGAELDIVAARAAAGLALADALSEWLDTTDDPASRLAGAALVVAAELGGPGAAAIDAAAASLRDRAAADDEVAALSVQARLSALLLTAAPVGFAVLLTSVDPSSARFLLGTPIGWACIGGGLLLDAAGAAWMAHLVRANR